MGGFFESVGRASRLPVKACKTHQDDFELRSNGRRDARPTNPFRLAIA
jgi:hypothetical protein